MPKTLRALFSFATSATANNWKLCQYLAKRTREETLQTLDAFLPVLKE